MSKPTEQFFDLSRTRWSPGTTS